MLYEFQDLLSQSPSLSEDSVEVGEDTFQISKVLDVALRRLADLNPGLTKTRPGQSTNQILEALGSVPDSDSLPVQGLSLCKACFHMDGFITQWQTANSFGVTMRTKSA